MFGYQGGESLETVTRKKAHMIAARERWYFLTNYDLTTVKNAAQLSALIGGRSSITDAQAEGEVAAWMVGKQF